MTGLCTCTSGTLGPTLQHIGATPPVLSTLFYPQSLPPLQHPEHANLDIFTNCSFCLEFFFFFNFVSSSNISLQFSEVYSLHVFKAGPLPLPRVLPPVLLYSSLEHTSNAPPRNWLDPAVCLLLPSRRRPAEEGTFVDCFVTVIAGSQNYVCSKR